MRTPFLTLLSFLINNHLTIQLVKAVNLFETFSSRGLRQGRDNNNVRDEEKFVGCEQSVLNDLSKLNGTGAKSYPIAESELQLCPNFCSNSSTLSSYCATHEADFVSELGADVRSGRCCDNEKCVCVCHFDCRTIRHKAKQFRNEGFRFCKWGSTRQEAIAKSRETCKKKRLKCTDSEVYLCAHQFLCVNKNCVACANPCCVRRQDKAVALQLLQAQNDTERNAINNNKVKKAKEVDEESMSSSRVMKEPLRLKRKRHHRITNDDFFDDIVDEEEIEVDEASGEANFIDIGIVL